MFNERQVVTSVLRGDVKAFEQLVKQYEHLVFYIVNRLVPGREDQEDICQEVFMKVYKGLRRFNFESRLSTWISRIAYFTAVNHVKKYPKERPNVYPEDLDDFYFTEETPASIRDRKDLEGYLDGLIASLPEKYRIVITLYHLNECSCPEIEIITGIPEGTVKSYLFRARKLLKEKIQKHFKLSAYDNG